MRTTMNYHFHDDASSDGTGTLREHVRAARTAGLTDLCVTNHAEVLGKEGRWELRLEEAVPRFLTEIATAGALRELWPGLRLRVGAELEYRPEWRGMLEALAAEVPFDFLLGSVHAVDGLNVSGGEEPARYFADRTREMAYRRYFETLEEMVDWGGFDVVAHFDLVQRFGYGVYGPCDVAEFETPIRRVLSRMVSRGLGIEVNSSGLRQGPGRPYPGRTILAWAREEGVPYLTIGTDGHAPHRIATGLGEGARAAWEAGWRTLTTFRERRPEGELPLHPPEGAAGPEGGTPGPEEGTAGPGGEATGRAGAPDRRKTP